MVKEHLYNDRQILFSSVANRCASQLTRGIEKQGRASFVVPGGTTPAPVFQELSNMSLLWNNIFVAPSDERWVAANHEQSNQRLIEQELLVNYAASARLMPLKNDAETPAQGEAIAARTINELEQPFDVTLLGMGADGHFASLFPGCPQLERALDVNQSNKCIGIDARGCPVAGDYTQRMSLTLSALLNSKLIILLITGQQKLDVIRQAEANGNPLEQPVTALLKQNQTPLEIYWAE